MKKDRTEIFESTPIPKAIAQLVLPCIAASLVSILYNLADTYFVGALNSEFESAGITYASNITLALIAVQNLFGSGGASYFGRCLGAKDIESAKRTASFAFWGAVAFGLLYSIGYALFGRSILGILGADGLSADCADGYLFYTVTLGAIPAVMNVVLAYLVRCDGRAGHASIGTMSGCLLNVILDPFFVLPQFLNMGAAGAGFATLISNCVACMYFFILLYKERDNTCVDINPAHAVPTKRVAREVFGVGIPVAIQNLLNVTGTMVLNNFASSYGDNAVAGLGIAHKLYIVPLYVTMAFGQGILPLLSYNFGAQNYERAKNCLKGAVLAASVLGVILVAIYFVGNEALVRMFIQKEEIVAYGSAYLKIACLAVVFQTFDFVGVSVYQAFGKGILAFFCAVARKILLEIPLLVIMNKLIPFYGLAYAQPITEVIMSIAALIIMIKLFSGLEKSEKKA